MISWINLNFSRYGHSYRDMQVRKFAFRIFRRSRFPIIEVIKKVKIMEKILNEFFKYLNV